MKYKPYGRSDFNALQNKQSSFTDKQISRWAKTILGVFAAVIAFVIFGLVGHEDYQTQLQEHTIDQCELNAPDCSAWIGKVEKDGHHEVLSDGLNRFWIETK